MHFGSSLSRVSVSGLEPGSTRIQVIPAWQKFGSWVSTPLRVATNCTLSGAKPNEGEAERRIRGPLLVLPSSPALRLAGRAAVGPRKIARASTPRQHGVQRHRRRGLRAAKETS